jgi:hypothetical protein
MTVPMPDLAQDSALSRGLELQLLLGAAIETLLRLKHAKADDRSLKLLEDLADRFERASDDLSGRPRTLAQSAMAVGFVTAAQRAFGDSAPRDQLSELSTGLRAASRNALSGPEIDTLVAALGRLHEVLAAARFIPMDEVRGLRRLA